MKKKNPRYKFINHFAETNDYYGNYHIHGDVRYLQVEKIPVCSLLAKEHWQIKQNPFVFIPNVAFVFGN